MASQQHAHPQYAQQNKGTLVPGQSITVNKYTVQVERYLSQGGFAHVYLVRTATPVYNTTHHVLKRIAVSNEAMLSEVKKEVDIMRLLKGHPNIVHLIDAAWHRMSNGVYEVFILMEFCSGGGIIDMMNRRLRERLTEAEILQIFVDVCEGVACMHNLRPALIHRDLKVENILQASALSFKLCDFGSATSVSPRPPSSMQEVRALEADLNRHTTLQYRAPEMVDPYLRRPVDEKSDIWALGVLLYKLCYYTTPFEEHGPLAILNVQYRIPPYPIYSPQLNGLIATMLREHGAHRPNIFELLVKVHDLRGTKSKFSYQPPVAQPLSPRKPTGNIDARQPLKPSNQVKMSVTPLAPKNPGVQARERVLEAIEPMRRGRPTASNPTPSISPAPPAPAVPPTDKNWLDSSTFGTDGDKAWSSALKDNGASKSTSAIDDAWKVDDRPKAPAGEKLAGFGDDFGQRLWESFEKKDGQKSEVIPPQAITPKMPPRPSAFTTASVTGNRSKDKDAFEGLGLSGASGRGAPTLGEARKLRTGLAAMGNNTQDRRPLPPTSPSGLSSSTPQSLVIPPPLRPSGSGSSWSSQPPISRPNSSVQEAAAESRFPSLEELDAQFGSPDDKPKGTPRTPVPSSDKLLSKPKTSSSAHRKMPSYDVTAEYSRPSHHSKQPTNPGQTSSSHTSRPSLTRKHRSSLIIKSTHNGQDSLSTPSTAKAQDPGLPQRAQTDWLTGEDVLQTPTHSAFTKSGRHSPAPETPILRDSPRKRASFTEQTGPPIKESTTTVLHTSPPPLPTSSPTVERFSRAFPALDDAPPPPPPKVSPTKPSTHLHTPAYNEPDSASSADEGPEDAEGLQTRTVKAESKRPKRKGRQSSVHDLVDLWGGSNLVSPTKERDVNGAAVRSTITPLAVKSVIQTDKSRPQPVRRPTDLGSPSKSRTDVPDMLPSKLPYIPSTSTTASGRNTGPTPSPGAAVPGQRSRPQSMFLFPAKSPDVTSPASPSPVSGLVPPEQPRSRPARRTSISDMVQLYETIGGPPHSSKPLPPIQTSPIKGLSNGRNPSLASPATDESFASRSRTSPNQFKAAPMGQTSSLPTSTADPSTPRARRTSLKPSSAAPSVTSRKTSLNEELPSRDPLRSPSPERPYQGVGRLIDQWQKKSTEVEVARPAPKRGALGTKRAGGTSNYS